MNREYTLANGNRLKVKAELSWLKGNRLPYFSITATEYDAVTLRRVSGGCLHEQILAADPTLAPLVDLHLSDSDGVPLHAEENGWYWLMGAVINSVSCAERYHGGNSALGGKSREECTQVLAKHLRLPTAYIEAYVKCFERWALIDGLPAARGRFTGFINTQRDRWAGEADVAISMFELEVPKAPA